MKLSRLLNYDVNYLIFLVLWAIEPLMDKCIGETASTIVLICGLALFLITIFAKPFLHDKDLDAKNKDGKYKYAHLFIALVGTVIAFLAKSYMWKVWIVILILNLFAAIMLKIKSRK